MFWRGERLARLRGQFSMAQVTLAKKLGTTEQTVSNWERNLYGPKGGALMEIARIFSTSPFHFYDNPDDDITN